MSPFLPSVSFCGVCPLFTYVSLFVLFSAFSLAVSSLGVSFLLVCLFSFSVVGLQAFLLLLCVSLYLSLICLLCVFASVSSFYHL